MSEQHSPLPWVHSDIHKTMVLTDINSGIDECIADCDRYTCLPNSTREANAAFIVEACNNYEVLKNEVVRLNASLDRSREERDELVDEVEQLANIVAGYSNGVFPPKARAILAKHGRAVA